MEDFKIGDKVVLKPGGRQVMVVAGYYSDHKGARATQVNCEWNVGSEIMKGRFEQDLLELAFKRDIKLQGPGNAGFNQGPV